MGSEEEVEKEGLTEPVNRSLEAALAYARAGFAVFPLKAKKPLSGTNGMHDATTASAVIRAWWENSPDFGVGIKIPEWCVVVDVDPLGLKSLKVFDYDLPDTVRTKTRRGHHHWYELPAGFVVQKGMRNVGFLHDVDICVNGYMVAPPSKHPLGGEYEWDEDSEPLLRKNCEKAPQWVIVALEEEANHKAGLSDDDFLVGLEHGKRQVGLFRRASRCCRIGNSKGEAKAILRDAAAKCDSSDYDTDGLVERVYNEYFESDAAKRKAKKEDVKIWSLGDLLTEVTEPPDYLVEDMLPSIGYTILHAPQGAGKSVLADQVAVCVATGKPIFGRRTQRSGVLVLDIEQDAHAATERWRRLLQGLGLTEPPDNLYTAFSWSTVDAGGFEMMRDFLADHLQVRLIICDTLGNFWPENEGGEQSNPYNRERRVMQRFVDFAKQHEIAFLIVHHDRKGSASGTDNFSDRASGTRGITGPAKARWSLQRKSFEAGGMLEVGGKIPERKIAVSFDSEFLVWR